MKNAQDKILDNNRFLVKIGKTLYISYKQETHHLFVIPDFQKAFLSYITSNIIHAQTRFNRAIRKNINFHPWTHTLERIRLWNKLLIAIIFSKFIISKIWVKRNIICIINLIFYFVNLFYQKIDINSGIFSDKTSPTNWVNYDKGFDLVWKDHCTKEHPNLTIHDLF